MINANRIKHWLRTIGYPERDRPERRNPIGLVATHKDSSSKLGHIKEISRTGFFLRTTERWPIGEIFSLSLQKEGARANESELKINIPVRVASHGEDGIGMAFVLPEGMSTGLWEHLVDTVDTPTESKDTQFIFRMVRAMLFLYRLCPSRAVEPIMVLTGELDEARTGSMLEIVLIAEKLLANEPDSAELQANPNIVAGILKSGSWQHYDLGRRLWGGLLASSCSKSGNDMSNQDLIEMLVEVTESQAHILVEACRRASEQTSSNDGTSRPRIIITSQEMTGVTGMYDMYRNATDVAYLHGNGLIQKGFDFSTHSKQTSFDITPTLLGLRLFKACRGHQFESQTVLS